MKTFEKLWAEVKGLPDTAMLQVPGVLSTNTKRKLCRKSPADVSNILIAAIDEVDHGSIEPLDILVSRRIS